MSIATAITDLSGRIQDAYTALSAKGATMPATKDSYHLSTAIESIPTGSPRIYNIDGVGMFGQVVNGQLVAPSEQQELILSGVTQIADTHLQYGLYYNIGISSVSFPDLDLINANNALNSFGMYSNIKTFAMDALTSIYDNGLKYGLRYSSIEHVSFQSLLTANSYAFNQFCNNTNTLKSISFPALKQITQYGFLQAFQAQSNNTQLSSISFPELQTIGGYGLQATFNKFSKISSISFPKLTTCGTCAFRGAIPMGTITQPIDEISFPALTSIPEGCFALQYVLGVAYVASKYVRNVYFPEVTRIVASTSQAADLVSLGGFTDASGAPVNIYLPKCTTISNTYLYQSGQNVIFHFAASNQSAIEATTGYAVKWGASTQSQVLFDL